MSGRCLCLGLTLDQTFVNTQCFQVYQDQSKKDFKLEEFLYSDCLLDATQRFQTQEVRESSLRFASPNVVEDVRIYTQSWVL